MKLSKSLLISFFLGLVSIIPLFLSPEPPTQMGCSDGEKFYPGLLRLNSLNKIEKYVDSLIGLTSNGIKDSALIVEIVSETVKKRFCHGQANYSISENWIAYLFGQLAWSHFSAIVKAEDILKHPVGLCSQQTIVFLEVLKRKGINFRHVGLGYDEGPGHFLCEVFYEGNWHLYDVTMEPNWEKTVQPHRSMEYYLSNKDSLREVYKGRMDSVILYKTLERVHYGEPGQIPGKKMALFHTVTKALTYLLPVVFFLLFARLLFFKKK